MGKLDGIADEIDDDLAQAPGIAAQAKRHVGGDVHHGLDALRGALQRHRGHGLVDQVAGAELEIVEIEPVCLDLGEIKHVVEQREQTPGAAVDDVDVFALLRRELGLAQEPRHADHRVHGRADLVADVGEEGALRAVRRLGREPRLDERRLRLLEVGDVDQGAGDAHDATRAVARDARLLGDPAHRIVLEQHAVFAAIERLTGGHVEGRAARPLEILRVDAGEVGIEIGELGLGWDGEELVDIVRGETFAGGDVDVEGGDAGGGLGDVEGIAGAAELLLELLALGDVAQRTDHVPGLAIGLEHDAAAAREPAIAAAQEQGAVFGLIVAALEHGGAELLDETLEIGRVDGGEPLVLGERQVAMIEAGELEEQRGAGDVAGVQVEVEHAEAARGLGELEKFAGAALLHFADARRLHGLLELGLAGILDQVIDVEERGVRLGRRPGAAHVVQLQAPAGDALADAAHQEETGKDGDEQCARDEGDPVARESLVRERDVALAQCLAELAVGDGKVAARSGTGNGLVCQDDRQAGGVAPIRTGQEQRRRDTQGCGQQGYGEQFAADRPTTHADLKRLAGPLALASPYRPRAARLEL